MAGLCLTLSACAGIPPKSTVRELPAEITGEAKLEALIGGTSEVDRNKWVQFNVIRINTQYFAFERELQATRTRWNVGTNAAALLFNVASSLTDSAGVKSNYVAANTLATGSNQIVSREEFLEQTVASLVAAMRARRAEAYKSLRLGMTKTVGEYNYADAHFDLLAFENAGTLTQGMEFLSQATKTASDDQVEKAKKEIAEAVTYTEDQRQLAYCLSESVDQRPISRDALAQVLLTLGGTVKANADADELANAISAIQTNNSPETLDKIKAALAANKLLLNPCPRYIHP